MRYIRGRPSSVYENADRSLTLVYENTLTGEAHEEVFDMVVLSTSVVPSPDSRRLANVLGVAIDEHGFFVQQDMLRDPLKSTRDGVFLAGGAQGPNDIPDSVAQASGAAGRAAAALRDRHGTVERKQAPEKEIDGDAPRTGVFVCSCGKNIGGYVDVADVTEYARGLPNVIFAGEYLFACSEDAQRRIKEAIQVYDLNRVVVAACSPITHGGVFQQTCEEAGINQNLFDMANIRNQCSWVHSHDRNRATTKSRDLVRMSVAKSAHLRPLSNREIGVTRACLIIGGGIAGIKAALTTAEMGIDTYLVEREAVLGGKLRDLYTLYPADIPAGEALGPLVSAVERHERIRVFVNSEVRTVDGYIGNFQVEVQSRASGLTERLDIGAIIVATGFQEVDFGGRYGYGEHPNIISQLELEQRLRAGTLGNPRTAVILNCAGSMDASNPSCCRIGCGVSVKNMRRIHEVAPNARMFLLYQDLCMFGKQQEEYFAETVRQVQPYLIRYVADRPPSVRVRGDRIFVTVFDVLLRDYVEVEADLVVLTTAMRGDARTPQLKQMLKVAANSEDFYNEAHAKIRPLDFATDGVYLCGSAHYPKSVPDTIAQAEGAASRAAIPLLRGKVSTEPIIAEIDATHCAGCGICVTLCPYGAISINAERSAAVITDVMCKGCGTCVAACPSGAAQQRNFTDQQLFAMIETAWD